MDSTTPPQNSLKQPVTVEDLLRFQTLTLQNIHPFLRQHILQQIVQTAKTLFRVHLFATYSGPHVHFQIVPLETEV